MPEVEKHYTLEEAAERLSVKHRTVLEWVRTGRLRAVKAGKLWRVPESALWDYLKAGEAEARRYVRQRARRERRR